MKGSRTRDRLLKVSELRGDKRIREAAEEKHDVRMLAITSCELVAAEAHNYFSCYRTYTRPKSSSSKEMSVSLSSEEQIYIEAENKAFQNLCSYIRDELLVTPKVVTMAFLRAKMITMMNDVGVEVIKDSTKKHLKRNLEQEFESTLHISLTTTGQLLFVPQPCL